MDNRQTICGVVLTLNEEKDILRSLASLSWCDEIIVLDSGSTDSTAVLAQQAGARFLQHIQDHPFLITEQRNWVLDQAKLTTDWVLFLDADEEISPILAKHIAAAIRSPSYDAYELTPRYWFLGKWLRRTQAYPNWHPRLVRIGHATFQGGVWESFSSNTNVGRISYPYEHYAFSKGIDDWIARHLRYATWDADQTIKLLRRECLSDDTPRKSTLRTLSYQFWPAKPLLRFVQKYFFQLGFLEGWQALIFCLLMFFYDLMSVVKIIESKRTSKGLPL